MRSAPCCRSPAASCSPSMARCFNGKCVVCEAETVVRRLFVTTFLVAAPKVALACPVCFGENDSPMARSEEHTSELQSRFDLVCRLLLEKKKNTLRCTYTL